MGFVIQLEQYVGIALVDTGDLCPERHAICVSHIKACSKGTSSSTRISPHEVNDNIQFQSSQAIHDLLDQRLILRSRATLRRASFEPEDLGQRQTNRIAPPVRPAGTT